MPISLRPLPDLSDLCIPAPRPRILARINHLADLIGGNCDPLFCGRYRLLAGVRLPLARISILGTACDRPLLCEEAGTLQAIIGDDVIILRLEEKGDASSFTADLRLSSTGNCLENCLLWKSESSIWIVPPNNRGKWIRPDGSGIRFLPAPVHEGAGFEEGLVAAQIAVPASRGGSLRG